MSTPALFKWRLLFARNHPAQRAVVLSLLPQFAGFGGNDGGAGSERGPLDNQSLGAEVCARTGQTHLTPFEADKRLVAS